MATELRFGSIFTGIGGFDLGFQDAGWECAWQVESNRLKQKLLKSKFKDVTLYDDVRNFDPSRVNAIVGGDPCPKHSRARSNGDSNHPDLSGYFLALAGRLRPRWLVRENVPAPTVKWFECALAHLGYGTCIVRLDASQVTGQSRVRTFVIGDNQVSKETLRTKFSDGSNGPWSYSSVLGTRQVTPALTAHRTRYDSRDCYIWHESTGLRILDSEERESLAGFPRGWTAGFSPATRARMLGESVVPALCEWIARKLSQPTGKGG